MLNHQSHATLLAYFSRLWWLPALGLPLVFMLQWFATTLFVLGVEDAKMKMRNMYRLQSGTDSRSAHLPAPLGGTCPAVTPSPEDVAKAKELEKDESKAIHHLEDERFLQYGIVAGRPIGPLCNPTPETAERVAKQERERVNYAESQKTSLINIDLTKG